MPRRERGPWRITGKEIDLEQSNIRDSRGRRIDNAYVDEVVASVHAQVDARPGRPSLSGAHAPSPQVTVRLDPELKALVEVVAAARGISVSQLTREALVRFVRAG